MKKIISILLVLTMAISCLAACGKENAGKGNEGQNVVETPANEEGNAPAKEPDSETSDENNDKAESGAELDMEAFFNEIASKNPGADLKTIEDAILADPYFVLFTHQDTKFEYDGMDPEYYYPALNYEYTPEGIADCICVADYITNSGAIIYVIDPEEGTDPLSILEGFKANSDPKWMDFEKGTDSMAGTVIDGRVYFALYNANMQSVEGKIAENARDFVEMFHDYIAENPGASTLDIAEYFRSHQKFTALNANSVVPGRITGFGDFDNEVEITGFTEGAGFVPLMTPNLFIGYVFKVDASENAESFAKMLDENANLGWNICMVANTIITETDGEYVLFMMCQEDTQ
ncbi:MAG: hypothetical protein K5858_09940 [Lachnospiraceae bacterium]|nr:hypothetical protein [Lachnospiraceae bacterium]